MLEVPICTDESMSIIHNYGPLRKMNGGWVCDGWRCDCECHVGLSLAKNVLDGVECVKGKNLDTELSEPVWGSSRAVAVVAAVYHAGSSGGALWLKRHDAGEDLIRQAGMQSLLELVYTAPDVIDE